MNLKRLSPLFVLPILVVGASLIYLALDLDFSRFWQAWQSFNPFYIALAMLLATLNILLLGLRLRFLSANRFDCVSACIGALTAVSLNMFIPAKLGEVAKIGLLSRRCKTTVSLASVAVFWERFLDINLLIAIALGATILAFSAEISLGIVAALLLLWTILLAIKRWPQRATALTEWMPTLTLKAFARDVAEHIRSGLNVRMVGGGFAFSVLPWAVYVAQVLLVLSLAAALELTLAQQLLVFVAASLTMSVPLTPGAIGVYEAAVVAVLVQFEVDKELALTTAIVMHSIQYLPALIGIIWVLIKFPSLIANQMQNDHT